MKNVHRRILETAIIVEMKNGELWKFESNVTSNLPIDGIKDIFEDWWLEIYEY